jgi:hypothetical protein
MRKIIDQPRQRNRESKSRPNPTRIWSAEFPINQRELLRAELLLHKTHAVLDLRRWFKPPNSTARSTGRGFALSIHHLPAIEALICAALAQVRAAGLLDNSGVA